ncbi:hypothetical protein N7491_000599 [Penicillium cf. griseofulvum]|uniref:Zn(2)-C6 fungal-type domain-containing protein n=1 Tax=Penicillium cf. griseofulvum TaxID=2972120 RepID=A0A9W9MD81_9EURO|nr:hypothetical protein N7472_004040 [Penicillium cf. griseofulvum]KAJ5442763.1 hypothetical protein N7445_004514 [Penicillium cf. griseofulvum]KAJ5451417.1 hypothetical protein N7491_000599 [Penicillium cf. griseofulvum]
MSSFRVRFAPQRTYHPDQNETRTASPDKTEPKPTHTRTRSGCRGCRQRHVKCDDAFPVCLRCRRRGSICQPVLPASQWQPEYWFERMSQIMSLDRDRNPMSFSIVKYLSASSSLVYITQCVSAAHEQHFQPSQMTVSLEEWSKALRSLRQELQSQSVGSPLCFLIILMLGMSSSWITTQPTDYVRELLAAQASVDMTLEHQATMDDDLVHLSMGFYVYWDMACSFCLVVSDHPQDSRTRLAAYVSTARSRFHTITSHSIDLYFLLGQLGRYYRSITDGMPRDFVRETTFEVELNSYTSAEENPIAYLLAEAFRNHGLLMLYRLCGRKVHFALEVNTDSEEVGSKCPIRTLALRTLEMLFLTPINSPAGAELESTDTELRERVIEQLQAAYSTNCIPSTLWVIELLQELWNLRDSGVEMTWLDRMLVKQWRLRIG